MEHSRLNQGFARDGKRHTSCSLRRRLAHSPKLFSRSSSSRFSSASFSSLSFSFSRRARARASHPAFKSFCFFFSLIPSSSSCRHITQMSEHLDIVSSARNKLTSASGTSTKLNVGSSCRLVRSVKAVYQGRFTCDAPLVHPSRPRLFCGRV